MMNPPQDEAPARSPHALSAEDRSRLEEARVYRLSGLDLRYEGGPWIDALNRLVDRGLLEFSEGTPAYFVSYRLTEAGQAALSADGDDDLAPRAP